METLLFSGEESSPSKRAVHLENGLRVVQLLDLGSCEKDKERVTEESSTLNADEELKDDQNQGQVVANQPSLKKEDETLPKGDSEWEDISDISDEGTPERDLPGMVTLIVLICSSVNSFHSMWQHQCCKVICHSNTLVLWGCGTQFVIEHEKICP